MRRIIQYLLNMALIVFMLTNENFSREGGERENLCAQCLIKKKLIEQM